MDANRATNVHTFYVPTLFSDKVEQNKFYGSEILSYHLLKATYLIVSLEYVSELLEFNDDQVLLQSNKVLSLVQQTSMGSHFVGSNAHISRQL